MTEEKLAATNFPVLQTLIFLETNTRTITNYEQQQEGKNLPYALIALNAQILYALNIVRIAQISFPEK